MTKSLRSELKLACAAISLPMLLADVRISLCHTCCTRRVGCKLVDNWTWESAPVDTPIIGLKELPVEKTPIKHTQIQFAHCYKQQGGWAEVLDRFIQGHGLLYDLEFLQDENGRRVAAFGFHAGFAGAAVACLALHAQVMSDGKDRLGALEPYPNESELVNEVKSKFSSVEEKLGRPVRVLVIGALGRCGRGAVSFFQKAGIKDENIFQWDMRETAKGGPFQEIIDGEHAFQVHFELTCSSRSAFPPSVHAACIRYLPMSHPCLGCCARFFP